MEYVIEKGIPIPPKNAGKQLGLASILRTLEIGDSVLFEKKREPSIGSAAKYAGICVTTRRVEGGIRIWRIA